MDDILENVEAARRGINAFVFENQEQAKQCFDVWRARRHI